MKDHDITEQAFKNGYEKGKQEAYKEILELIPEKMISESVRYDSPYGISRMCNVSMEEAEIIKDKYSKLQELRKTYIEEGRDEHRTI